jgi:hypothetical protein
MSKRKSRGHTGPEAVRDSRIGERGNSTLKKSPLDYILYKVVSYALKNGFTPPFQLQLFESGKDAVIRETRVTVKNSEVFEEVVSVCEGPVCFPLECKLADRNGRRHTMVVSNEEMRRVFEAMVQMDAAGLDYTFHETGVIPAIEVSAESPDFSREIYAAVVGMLIAACREGLNSPFEIEVRDANGLVQGRTEIDFDAKEEFRETEVANCDRGAFPMTVKLVDGDGREFIEVVERRN